MENKHSLSGAAALIKGPENYFDSSFSVNLNTEMSGQIGEIAKALSKAQSEFESTGKDQTGYGYSYSDLASVIRTAKPVLSKNGLAVTQLLSNTDKNPTVTTILVHESGQFFKTITSLPLIEMKGCNEAQRAGAVYSYIRRYAYQAILGLSSEDNDASSEGTNKPATRTSFTKSASKEDLKTDEKPLTKPSGQKFRKKVKTEVEHEI